MATKLHLVLFTLPVLTASLYCLSDEKESGLRRSSLRFPLTDVLERNLGPNQSRGPMTFGPLEVPAFEGNGISSSMILTQLESAHLAEFQKLRSGKANDEGNNGVATSLKSFFARNEPENRIQTSETEMERTQLWKRTIRHPWACETPPEAEWISFTDDYFPTRVKNYTCITDTCYCTPITYQTKFLKRRNPAVDTRVDVTVPLSLREEWESTTKTFVTCCNCRQIPRPG